MASSALVPGCPLLRLVLDLIVAVSRVQGSALQTRWAPDDSRPCLLHGAGAASDDHSEGLSAF